VCAVHVLRSVCVCAVDVLRSVCVYAVDVLWSVCVCCGCAIVQRSCHDTRSRIGMGKHSTYSRIEHTHTSIAHEHTSCANLYNLRTRSSVLHEWRL
jgi:hypothetical protein